MAGVPGKTAMIVTAVLRTFAHGLSGCLVIAALLLIPQVHAAENSEPAPLAARTLLLGAVSVGDKIVSVGDHGNVVISHDDGRTWTQIIVPTRALLTAVSFPDTEHGWAVGHDGVIISSVDGGQTWHRQDDGKNPDTVLLDVHFLNASEGFAVGAYGKFLTTLNAGKTWTIAQPAGEEVHYNQLSASSDGTLYIAGESGTFLISRDHGKKWRKSDVPYDGSLFGAIPLEQNALIAYGLRGHILRSDDDGVTWVPHHSDTKVLISCGVRLKNGLLVLGGQGGNFFISRDGGHSFTPWKPAEFSTGVAAIVEAQDGALITFGEAGAVRLKLP